MPDFPNLEVGGTGFKLNDIYTDISPQALGQLVDYVAQSGVTIPVSQIIGFTTFTAQSAPLITASDTTTSTTYVDLAHAGPTLSNISNGKYVIAFGCNASNSGQNATYASPSVNGATPSDNDACSNAQAASGSIARLTTATLSAGNNTVKIQYRTAAGTATYLNRWMVLLKYTNA